MTIENLRNGFQHLFTSMHILRHVHPKPFIHPPFPIYAIVDELALPRYLFQDSSVTEDVYTNLHTGTIITHAPDVRPEAELRFDLAFGLGRLLTGWKGRSYYDVIDHNNVNDDQREAYRFACDLIMPEWSIRTVVDRVARPKLTVFKPWKWRDEIKNAAECSYVATLAPMYGVTQLAMERRLASIYGGDK